MSPETILTVLDCEQSEKAIGFTNMYFFYAFHYVFGTT